MALSNRFISLFRAGSVGFLLAALLVAAAHAADKKGAAPAAAKTAILTPAQLRDCLAQQQRRDKETDAALKVKAEIAAERAEIDRSAAALAEQLTALDRTSAEAVEAHNAAVDARNKRVDSYEAKVSAFDKEAERVNAMQDVYEKSCGNRRYDDRDLLDLQRKK